MIPVPVEVVRNTNVMLHSVLCDNFHGLSTSRDGGMHLGYIAASSRICFCSDFKPPSAVACIAEIIAKPFAFRVTSVINFVG